MYEWARSETFAWASGSKKSIPLDFMDRNGFAGKRAVVEKMLFLCILNSTTAAANTLVGADMAGFISRLLIRDAAGPRVYLTGAELRVFAHAEGADTVFDDPTTHAASTTQNDTYIHVVNFAQERSLLRADDFAIPVDDLLNGGALELQMPTSAEILQTGSGLVINSGTYQLLCLLREENEIEFKCRDQRESIDAQSAASILLPGNGRLMRSAYAYKAAQGGGSSWAALTDFTIEPFKMVTIPGFVGQWAYLSRLPVKAQDPFAIANSKAFPFVFPKVKSKLNDLANIPGNLYIRTTGAPALPFVVLCHWVAPKDAGVAQRTIDTRPVKAPVLVKTENGDRVAVEQAGDLAPFLPLVAQHA